LVRIPCFALALALAVPAVVSSAAQRPVADDVVRRLVGVETALAAYYGGDASHERVRQVLSWLATNRSRLAAEYRSEQVRAKVPRVGAAARSRLLAFWLGVRYAAERFRVAEAIRYPPIVAAGRSSASREALAAYEGSARVFLVGRELFAPVPAGRDGLWLVRAFDVGLHECAHALRYVNGAEPTLTLSELAAYVVQTRLALPVKRSDAGRAESYRYGCRDFNRLVEMYRALMAGRDADADPDYLEAEYLGFAFGPWLRPDPTAVLSLVPSRSGEEPDWTIQSVLANAERARALAADPSRVPDEGEAPIAVSYLTTLFCDREGIADAVMRERVASVFQWVEDCVGGAAEGGRFGDLAERLTDTRDFALRRGKYRRFRGAAPPASVVRARVEFVGFLDALRAKLTTTFGQPEQTPIPAGYV
jgi:hypothetical protein